MTQADKYLLLKDRSGRVLYGVKFKHSIYPNVCEILSITPIYNYNNVEYFDDAINHPKECDVDEIKPYLFPLSSMTEEQKEELDKYFDMDTKSLLDGYKNGLRCPHTYFIVQDWYNKNHFDYRGLIEKGLAIDATGLNIY